MRITWLTIDRSKRAGKHIYEGLQEAMAAICDVKIVTRPAEHPVWPQYKRWCDNEEIQQKLVAPSEELATDAVICDAGFGFLNEDLRMIKCPKVLLIEDTHGEYVKKYLDTIKDLFDAFLLRYPGPAMMRHPWLSTRRWLHVPHSIDAGSFKPLGIERKHTVTSVGFANDRMYPVRLRATKELSSLPGYRRIERPKEGTTDPWPVGQDYINVLNETKAAVSCTAKVNYTVIKTFEIPACGAVLMSDVTDDMRSLGFKHGKNCVDLSQGNAKDLAERFIIDDDSRSKIAAEGLLLIQENHTTSHRARAIKKFIEDL